MRKLRRRVRYHGRREVCALSNMQGSQGTAPSRVMTRRRSPRRAVPDATRPVAMRPTNASASSIVTSILNSPAGSPAGGGTCATMASKSGARLASSGLPLAGNWLQAHPCACTAASVAVCHSLCRNYLHLQLHGQ